MFTSQLSDVEIVGRQDYESEGNCPSDENCQLSREDRRQGQDEGGIGW